jgi:hypothetical protein
MGKPRDGKVPILPSTTRRGTTLNTSVNYNRVKGLKITTELRD